jgi:DNA (cytosine-5)-methyltransferase 1
MWGCGIGNLIPFQGRLYVFYSGMDKDPLTFVDLFAGIGGFHEAFHELGAACVMACERDKHARLTYQEFHRKKVADPDLFFSECKDTDKGAWRFPRDLTEVTKSGGKDDKWNDDQMAESIEHIRRRTVKFNLLCAGFPCQPFSHAGKRLGFDDARGTLFFDVALMLKARKPEAFFLENVRGLIRHRYDVGAPVTLNGAILPGIGATLGRILNVLFSTDPDVGLGYHYPNVDKKDPRYVAPGVFLVRASDHSLPQHRPRIFIIGFKSKAEAEAFVMPRLRSPTAGSLAKKLGVAEVFVDSKGEKPRKIGFTLRCGGKQSPIIARQNWDSYYVRREGGDDIKDMRIEWQHALGLQGFPDRRGLPDGVSSGQMMKQLGNSVAVPAIKAWGRSMLVAMGRSLDSED